MERNLGTGYVLPDTNTAYTKKRKAARCFTPAAILSLNQTWVRRNKGDMDIMPIPRPSYKENKRLSTPAAPHADLGRCPAHLGKVFHHALMDVGVFVLCPFHAQNDVVNNGRAPLVCGFFIHVHFSIPKFDSSVFYTPIIDAMPSNLMGKRQILCYTGA